MGEDVDDLRALLEERPPVAELVGFEIVDLGEGRAVMELEAGPEHHNPMGTLHGGIVCDVADGAMGAAWATTLGDGETFTTLEMDAKFLEPVVEATLQAEAEVVKRGGTTGLVECDVRDEDGALVARVQSTVMVLEADRGPSSAPGQ